MPDWMYLNQQCVNSFKVVAVSDDGWDCESAYLEAENAERARAGRANASVNLSANLSANASASGASNGSLLGPEDEEKLPLSPNMRSDGRPCLPRHRHEGEKCCSKVVARDGVCRPNHYKVPFDIRFGFEFGANGERQKSRCRADVEWTMMYEVNNWTHYERPCSEGRDLGHMYSFYGKAWCWVHSGREHVIEACMEPLTDIEALRNDTHGTPH